MIIADCHMHTHHSADSKAPMTMMIESAISKGLKSICFTEHMDFDYPPEIIDGETVYFEVDMPAYIKEFTHLKEKYANQIELLFGIELGMMPYLADRYKSFIANYNFDFIIASSHLVNGKDPYFPEFFENRSEEEGYRSYFETIVDNIKAFDQFDTYGHIDYVVRYGANINKNYSYLKYADILDQILRTIISSGKALEINTGGYLKGLGQPHPQLDVLKRFKELGGELITIGSDAHKPQDIAGSFHILNDLLTDVGLKYYAVYKGRKPVIYKI